VSLIVLRLGGGLQIVGRQNAGSVVEITLPLAQPVGERVD